MQDDEKELYQPLIEAIILQAVRDYRNALAGRGYNGKSPEAVITECEEFFHSDYFSRLTKVSGQYLIDRIRKEV